MAYRVEQDGRVVIDGFEAGIGDSPYATQVDATGYRAGGLTDMRNVNIISIPGEASVSFSTSQASFSSFSGSVASADASADTVTYSGETGTPVNGMALVFAGGSLPSGITAGSQSDAADSNVYWIFNVNTNTKTFQIATAPFSSTPVNITSNGTGTFATINMTQPTYFDPVTGIYLLDTTGRAWKISTNWVYLGNNTRTNANGNGIITYAGYLLVFRNAAIDYTATGSISWVTGWLPASGTSGGSAMQTGAGTNNPHQPVLGGSDNRIYYPDGNAVSWFSQNTAQTFDPTNTATYTYSPLALLLSPPEVSQCVAVLGTNLLVGGIRNIVYSWDRTSSGYNPIYIAENVISKIVSVNSNAYIFAGNRGRIYITNGAQAQLYKKVPDHLSGTIEPLYTWGGATAQKNQLYFGVMATNNAGTPNSADQYGGLWAIDLDTKAIRLVSQLSYGTYAGYATAIAPLSGTVAGFALYIGWNSGASTYGADQYPTSPVPYGAGPPGPAYVISDLIPVGTFIRKTTYRQVEFKLSVPLVSGESVQLLVGSTLSGAFTSCGTYSFISGAENMSANFPMPLENLQWLKVKAILISTASTPSYVRLKELSIY